MQCRELAKTIDKLAGTLENLQKLNPNRPKCVSSKEDQETCRLELGQTQEMLNKSWTAHNKAVAKMYELWRNFLSSDPLSE